MTRASERTTTVAPLPFERPTVSGGGTIQIAPGGAGSPIIRGAPPYPEACASKGIEGVVLVQFDVTAEGNVANIQVISSPNPCFNRAVIRAVSGWKYAPVIRDGRPMARYGVTERLVFELKE